MTLSNEEREALAWVIYDGGPSREDFLAGIETQVEAIVARHVEAALNAAADEIEGDARRYMFMAENKMRGFKERDQAYGAHIAAENAARIVRASANTT